MVRMPLDWEETPGQTKESRTRLDYIDSLALDHLGIPQEEVANVAWDREIWSSLVELLPPGPNYG